jgi:excinuclease ABC subunit C
MTRTPNPTSARSSKAAAPADGGVIYEETDTDEDEQEAVDAPLPADVANVAGMEWNESPGVTPGLKGAEVIQAFVRHLPNQPGVYRMMNEAGDVLYVGKARSLKKRVTNYAQGRGHSNRITRMIAQTANMEFVTTRTETEALLLEANLIKRLKPRFNVLDARRQVVPLYPGDRRSRGAGYLQAPWRAIAQGILFRPLRLSRRSGRTINALQRAFLLRTCTDSVYESRTRPCLLYQIKRCAGPCTGEIDAEGYARLVGEAKDFLSGRSQAVKAQLATAMQSASEDLDFERAAVYRDRLSALSHVQSHQGINPQTVEEADVFAIHHDAAWPASRCSSSAPGRTGATAPISPRPTRRWRPARSLAPSSASSTTTSRRRG